MDIQKITENWNKVSDEEALEFVKFILSEDRFTDQEIVNMLDEIFECGSRFA